MKTIKKIIAAIDLSDSLELPCYKQRCPKFGTTISLVIIE